ncbi:RICIN domain-containing protein [Actinoallomurus sp. NPDC050550]|uniref:RICIN domain-containing protein n=1 Tax=Actinoallomurus sp. NPDC050550 TaxID=3154937 RepID=UPI0033E32A2C
MCDGSCLAVANPTRFTITDEGHTSVLDVAGGGTTNGSHVILYHPNGGYNQQWRRRPAGYAGRYDRLVSVYAGKCMDVDNGPWSRLGSRMNVWTCHPRASRADTQNFDIEHLVPWLPNLHTVSSEGTGFSLNVAGGGTADNTPIIQWTQEFNRPYPGWNESFYFHPVINFK